MSKENQTQMLNLRRPCFYHSFSSDLSSQILKIPTQFIRHLEGRTSGPASLVGPSGNMWHVDLIEQNGDLYFDLGWPVFVRDNFIECGDILVFRYDGELHFTVQMFGQSTCEKEASFTSKCSQDTGKFDNIMGQKRAREEVAVPSDKIFQIVLKKIRKISPELNSECIDNEQEANSSEETTRSGSLSKCLALLSQSKPCDVKLEHEEKKVAQSFNSSFPYFVRIMKKFNISGSYTLNVPYQFSMAHLPNCKTEITLRNLKGASWTVNSVPTTKVHTNHTFCGGWLAFVRSNEINAGDICIFELERPFELRVYILRVGKEDTHSQNGKVASTGSNAGSAATSRKKLKNSLMVYSKCTKKVSRCNSKGSTICGIRKDVNATLNSGSVALCSQSNTGNENPGTAIRSRKNVEAEMDSQARSNLRMVMALDEEKAARSFTSHFPHFVRIMRKFNVSGSYTLKIPYKFSMAHLPDCKTEIVLRNLKGECWNVNSVPDSKGRMVHTFCGGWELNVKLTHTLQPGSSFVQLNIHFAFVTTINKVVFGFPLRHRIAAAAVAGKYRSWKIWKMEDACNGCVSWEEEMYWSHFQCKHFIQYLHTGFDQQLDIQMKEVKERVFAIPEKFARNLKKKLGETLSLKGPSGNTWNVE
ncbi:hypothetical protein LWI28_027194 [Acer negundo]|uniref:TF-B3 domain-containing protein n=1 Tax=Acer negundo TaxID=4023 RepID=A0AAD5P801_ACENE|nr:hypothetical protein LWI28_027194 [Acer negundo]